MKSKNNNSFLSISSSEDNSNNEENINSKEDNYHNIFKGLSPSTDFFKPKLIDNKELNKEKEEINKKYIISLRERLNNNTTKIKDKKLLILPSPENDLTDNHYHNKNLIDDDDINEKKLLSKLINPDNINIKNDIEQKTDNNIKSDDKEIISVIQKDILDSNWEIKYIKQILKKDMNESIKKEEENDGKNKIIDGKKRKRNKENNFDKDDNIKSKYSKISTKKKYGW
jgi:hypothetical protein